MSVAGWPWPDDRCVAPGGAGSITTVIYCVVPEEMAGELYGRLVDYYEEDLNVTVIVDRRHASRRTAGTGGGGLRERRDRRRSRVAGEFPPIDAAVE